MSFNVRYPEPNTIAFVGVANGNINEYEVLNVRGSRKYPAGIWFCLANASAIGNRIDAIDVFVVNLRTRKNFKKNNVFCCS